MLLFLFLNCSEYSVTDKLTEPSGGQIDSSEQPSDTSEPASEPSIEPATEPAGEPTSEPTDDGFIPDDSSTPNDPLRGRVVTILLTLSNQWLDEDSARQLIINSVEYVSPMELRPNVLIIRDDNTNGEDETDSENIRDWLINDGYNITFLEEPIDGISPSDLIGFHVVILSNPGFPPDDISTLQAMRDFSQQGFGIIFQGDDMAQFGPDQALLESMTRLEFIDNGTTYFDYTINDNLGDAYAVTINPLSPLADEMSTIFFLYGNDIDTTASSDTNNSVVAWCTVQNTTLSAKPVITAYTP